MSYISYVLSAIFNVFERVAPRACRELTRSARADIYTREQLIESFDLSRVTASPAQFDQAKLKWINGQHLRAMPKDDFMPVMEAALLADGVIGQKSAALTAHVAGMVQEKCDLVNDAAAILSSSLDYELAETAKSSEEAAGQITSRRWQVLWPSR